GAFAIGVAGVSVQHAVVARVASIFLVWSRIGRLACICAHGLMLQQIQADMTTTAGRELHGHADRDRGSLDGAHRADHRSNSRVGWGRTPAWNARSPKRVRRRPTSLLAW